jgi:hypothetical protein
MKFCPVVPEICRGHVHVAKKERRIIIIIIIRNGAKTISLQTTFGRLNYQYSISLMIKGGWVYYRILWES